MFLARYMTTNMYTLIEKKPKTKQKFNATKKQ